MGKKIESKNLSESKGRWSRSMIGPANQPAVREASPASLCSKPSPITSSSRNKSMKDQAPCQNSTTPASMMREETPSAIRLDTGSPGHELRTVSTWMCSASWSTMMPMGMERADLSLPKSRRTVSPIRRLLVAWYIFPFVCCSVEYSELSLTCVDPKPAV